MTFQVWFAVTAHFSNQIGGFKYSFFTIHEKRGGGGGWRSEGGLIAAPRNLVGDLISWKHTIFLMKKSLAG